MKISGGKLLSFAGIAVATAVVLKLVMRQTCVRRIDVNAVQDLLDENMHNPDFVILDVRPVEEYTKDHIEVAISVDFHAPAFRDVVNKLDKQKTYLVYSSGDRSGLKAAHTMKQQGFRHVLVMSGGFEAWQEMQDNWYDQQSV